MDQIEQNNTKLTNYFSKISFDSVSKKNRGYSRAIQ